MKADWFKWEKAMQEEMDPLVKNMTRVLVDKPSNKKVTGSKWIHKRKFGIPGVKRPIYTARLVVKGYTQVEGIDYHEVFYHVIYPVLIREGILLVRYLH